MSTTTFDKAALITGEASGAIPQYARVTGPVGTDRVFTVAAADDRADAILMTPTLADGEQGQFKLLSGADTNFGIAAGEIAAGATIYGAADGELNDVQAVGAFAEGYAITAAAADGDPFEWRYKPGLTAGT